MPGLTPGIHASLFVDGRVKRGHDDWNNQLKSFGLDVSIPLKRASNSPFFGLPI
jgi:hypothetical protein